MEIQNRNTATSYGMKADEKNGLQLAELFYIINKELPRLSVLQAQPAQITLLHETIDKLLLPKNITLVNLFTPGQVGHTITFAKDTLNNIFLFDPQSRQYFVGNSIDNYLKNYTMYISYCSRDNLKRKYSDLFAFNRPIRKRSLEEEPPSKILRTQGGMKSKKHTQKLKKNKKKVANKSKTISKRKLSNKRKQKK